MLSSFYGDTDSHASDVGHWRGNDSVESGARERIATSLRSSQ